MSASVTMASGKWQAAGQLASLVRGGFRAGLGRSILVTIRPMPSRPFALRRPFWLINFIRVPVEEEAPESTLAQAETSGGA
ncbi:hypothetical protein [Thermogymnomonas acidicola]|uniref:hypothetical protein n=1 Tax=Thermogymnomonas acidicola TaxID=399579 RepID=UPI0009462245|nr:hypothetical protein [Thermogymnomonas acidicola]